MRTFDDKNNAWPIISEEVHSNLKMKKYQILFLTILLFKIPNEELKRIKSVTMTV